MASWSADISRLKKATPAPGRFLGRDAVLHVLEVAARGVERDVGGERGLAHARAAGEDDQVRIVEAAGLGVDRIEAGGEAGKAAAGVERLLGHLHGHAGRHREALDRAFAAAFLGDAVERRLGILDLALGIDLVRGVERLLDHLPADADQSAKQGEVVNLLGEIARADDRRARAGQLGEIGRAAQLLHLLVGLEQRPERDRRGDHVLVEEAQDLLVDPAVQRLVEMLGTEFELDVLGQPVVDHQRAEQSGLGLDIGGEDLGGGRGVDEGKRLNHGSHHVNRSAARLKPATLWN